MASKSAQLQIRVTPDQKRALRRAARRAGQGMSEYVLSRALPSETRRFEELTALIGDAEERRFALAELNDLLANLPAARFAALGPPEHLGELPPYEANYLAAMVEQAAARRGVEPPGWASRIEPLARPAFATPLAGLRLHLLHNAPVAFRRRNIFVDTAVGDRV